MNSNKGNVLITGASTGIGAELAKLYCQNDFKVFGSVRKQEDGERLKSQLGENFNFLVFDVVEQSSIRLAAKSLKDKFEVSHLDLLINNAGIAVTGPSELLDVEDYRRQFEVNFFGVIQVVNEFLNYLKASSGGRIINMSSVASQSGMPFMIPYGSSKAALDAYSRGLRRELLVYGIDVIVFNPGPIDTPIWDKVEQPSEKEMNSPYWKALENFNKLVDKESSKAYSVSEFANLVYAQSIKNNPKPFQLVVKNKFLKYTLPNLILAERAYDKLLNKIIGLTK